MEKDMDIEMDKVKKYNDQVYSCMNMEQHPLQKRKQLVQQRLLGYNDYNSEEKGEHQEENEKDKNNKNNNCFKEKNVRQFSYINCYLDSVSNHGTKKEDNFIINSSYIDGMYKDFFFCSHYDIL